MMYLKKTILFLVPVICFMHLSTAQDVKEVACRGKVLDARGRPVAGAKVAAYKMQFDGIAGNFELHKVGELTTKADGAFTFTSESKPERSTFADCKIVAVKDDLSLGWTVWSVREDAEINIRLGKPQSLSGMVVDEAGELVSGANVYVNLMMNIKTNTGEDKKDWLPGIEPMMCLSTWTNEQGEFLFNNLPENAEVGLLIKAAGMATTYITESESNISSPIRTGQNNVKVEIPKEGRIKGRMLEPDTDKGIAELKFAIVYTASGLFYYRFVCTTDDNGEFGIGGLQTGKYLIRGTGLPDTYVNVKSGETTEVTIYANKPYYGRLLYEDGSPVAIKSLSFPETMTIFEFGGVDQRSRLNFGGIDDDGYFRVYLSTEQLRNLQTRKSWFEIFLPDTDTSIEGRNVVRREIVFAIDVLATDKTKAGVAKIPKPRREPDSLAGKQLPDIKNLNVEISKSNIENKVILVCFFDMNQRPSRRCINQINERIKQFEDKDVAVVGIQASKVGENSLNEWIKSNSILFPVGFISTDIEELKFKWGVKSLPWLIWTDKKHIVIAEGFAVDELEKKLD